ncbi:hypothetical protein AB0F72_09705 [Actinoplanes sp. NPDC023936]|uniref:hypothetical protein n=1 Tax=Actinoplanes sp. NPDC023936 TaxID=3154910 RepID=UPI00340F67F2
MPGDEIWVCGWCYAVIDAGIGPRNYERPERRWERAEMDGWEDQPRHAYGYFGSTLCGIAGEDVSASPYPWVPGWATACPACRSAATVIDDRWPRGRRQPRPIRAGFDPAVDDGPPF